MSDEEFQRGYRGESQTYNVPLSEQYAYQDGVNARREQEQRAAEQEWRARAEQDRIRRENERNDLYSTSYDTPRGGGGVEAPEMSLSDFYLGLPLMAGVIAAAVAFFIGQPALYWGAVVGGGLFAILMALVVVTGGVMALAWAVRQVLSNWIWIFGIAALGAALGYGVATLANSPSAIVQQRAIDYGLVGAAAGLALGLVNRAVRALRS